MSKEGFIRARLRGWQNAIARLSADHAICLNCGERFEMASLVEDKTPCCGKDYLQGQNKT
ncbi:MAG TPA: hypothetical protein VKX96_07370 [Chloroflexota bacterium]|nr:hypothetical protein [Chloroflexota bacterium]